MGGAAHSIKHLVRCSEREILDMSECISSWALKHWKHWR